MGVFTLGSCHGFYFSMLASGKSFPFAVLWFFVVGVNVCETKARLPECCVTPPAPGCRDGAVGVSVAMGSHTPLPIYGDMMVRGVWPNHDVGVAMQ